MKTGTTKRTIFRKQKLKQQQHQQQQHQQQQQRAAVVITIKKGNMQHTTGHYRKYV